MSTETDRQRGSRVARIEDSPVARALFGDVRWSWIWLLLRLYAGWQWVQAGWGKLHSSAWVGAHAGSALSGFVTHALTLMGGQNPAVQSWYGWFLQNVVLPHSVVWGYAVSWGETLVGAALLLGIFTGIAAFFGVFLNFNYLLAGSVSINPILMIIGIGLLLAWKTAGWLGVDHWLLPLLGTPWSPGYVFHPESAPAQRHTQEPSHCM